MRLKTQVHRHGEHCIVMMGNMEEKNKAFRFAKGLGDKRLTGSPHIMPVTCKRMTRTSTASGCFGPFFLHLLDNRRQNLVQVSEDSIVSLGKERSLRILVNNHYPLGSFAAH